MRLSTIYVVCSLMIATSVNAVQDIDAVISRYSKSQLPRNVVQRGAKKIYKLFLEACERGKGDAFLDKLGESMENQGDNLLPLKVETYFYLFNQKPTSDEDQKTLKTFLGTKLNPNIVKYLRTYLQRGVDGFLDLCKKFPPENVNFWLLRAFPTRSGNALASKIDDYFEQHKDDLLFNNSMKSEHLALRNYVRDYHIYQAIYPKLTVEGLLRLYDLYPSEQVNMWLLKEFPTESGNALVTENKINDYLANKQILGTDLSKLTLKQRNNLNSYVRDYHIFRGYYDKPKAASPSVLQEAVESYLQQIEDILKDKPENIQESLKELYDQAKQDGDEIALQSALVKSYRDELRLSERIPGPVMDFCEKFLPSLKSDAPDVLRKGVIDVWQNVDSKEKPDESRLQDIFNFLLEPGNEEILKGAQVVPNMYLDAVIQGARMVALLQGRLKLTPFETESETASRISTEFSRLQNILGGKDDSSKLEDFLFKIGIGRTAEDTERNSGANVQSDSDLFNKYPGVWFAMAKNLIESAKKANLVDQVEKVLEKSIKTPKRTLKEKVGAWLRGYCGLRKIYLRSQTRKLSDGGLYDYAQKMVEASQRENEILGKVDQLDLLRKVRTVISQLTDENSQEQRDQLLRGLRKVVPSSVIQTELVNKLPLSLRSSFRNTLGDQVAADPDEVVLQNAQRNTTQTDILLKFKPNPVTTTVRSLPKPVGEQPTRLGYRTDGTSWKEHLTKGGARLDVIQEEEEEEKEHLQATKGGDQPGGAVEER